MTNDRVNEKKKKKGKQATSESEKHLWIFRFSETVYFPFLASVST